MKPEQLDFGQLPGVRRSASSWPLGLRAHLGDLAETLLHLKMFQAFDLTPARYTAYRELRFASRQSIDELFDLIARESHWTAQRLVQGRMVLQGDGLYVQMEARRKTDYSTGKFQIWADTIEHAHNLADKLSTLIGDQLLRGRTFTIDWRFVSKSSGLTEVTFDELADESPLDEAYPFLRQGIARFTENFLAAPETVLILQGPPGTGKTRLVREILAAVSRRKNDSALVLFTADRLALEGDEIFVDFLTGEHDVFFVEDADHLLGARSNGNTELHRFLTIADGVVRALGRKIIFTTNLPNIGDIDEALLRPGRSYATVQARALTAAEITPLLHRLVKGDAAAAAGVASRLSRNGKSTATLAEIYQATRNVKSG